MRLLVEIHNTIQLANHGWNSELIWTNQGLKKFPLLVLFFLMGRLMTSFLPSTGRSLDCLLPEPSLVPQSFFKDNQSTIIGVQETHFKESNAKSLDLLAKLEKNISYSMIKWVKDQDKMNNIWFGHLYLCKKFKSITLYAQ